MQGPTEALCPAQCAAGPLLGAPGPQGGRGAARGGVRAAGPAAWRHAACHVRDHCSALMAACKHIQAQQTRRTARDLTPVEACVTDCWRLARQCVVSWLQAMSPGRCSLYATTLSVERQVPHVRRLSTIVRSIASGRVRKYLEDHLPRGGPGGGGSAAADLQAGCFVAALLPELSLGCILAVCMACSTASAKVGRLPHRNPLWRGAVAE